MQSEPETNGVTDGAPSESAVAEAAPADVSSATGRRRFTIWWILGPILIAVAGLFGAASLTTAPYIMLQPGSAKGTEALITVPSKYSHSSDGQVMFLTVSVVHPTYLAAVWGWLNPDIDVFPYKVIYGTQTVQQNETSDLQAMQQSKSVAAEVALTHLGYSHEVATGTLINEVVVPQVAKLLHPNDTVVAVDGKPTLVVSQFTAALGRLKPGDHVRLTVRSPGQKSSHVITETLTVRPKTKDTAFLGVQPTTNYRFDLDFPVSVDSGQVGGPSAGLAFTLGLLDRLTPGSITGGHLVAVTGEIDQDGNVLDVGGVRQKAVAARRAGAVMMIVPVDEYPDALKGAGHMKVVKVRTLEDALRALASIGGNGLRLGRPGQTTSS